MNGRAQGRTEGKQRVNDMSKKKLDYDEEKCLVSMMY